MHRGSKVRVNTYRNYYELTPIEGHGSVTITGAYSKYSLQRKLRQLRRLERSFRNAEVSIEEAEPLYRQLEIVEQALEEVRNVG